MTRYYAVRIVNGNHVVGVTTDGLDWLALDKATFATPRQAIRYAALRQADVQPLRSPDEVAALPGAVIPPGPESPAADAE